MVKSKASAPLASVTSPTMVEIELKAAKAAEHRRDGWTYQDIAEELGYATEAEASNAVRARMAQVRKDTEEDLAAVRRMEDDRLQWLWKKVADKIEGATGKGPVVEAPLIQAALKIVERRAKLRGLDAPTRHEHDVQFGMSKLEAENSSDRRICIRMLQKQAIEHGDNPIELAKTALLELGDMAPPGMVQNRDEINVVDVDMEDNDA